MGPPMVFHMEIEVRIITLCSNLPLLFPFNFGSWSSFLWKPSDSITSISLYILFSSLLYSKFRASAIFQDTMLEWISNFEELLPQWLGQLEMLWIQWAYALWQIVRSHPLTLLVLSYLPFYISQRRKKNTVVVLGASKDYEMPVADMKAYFRNHSLRNLEIIRKNNGNSELLPTSSTWMAVKHSGYYYLTHVTGLCQLAECSRESQRLGQDLIFVEMLLPVTGSLAVGRKLSETEAYERIFSQKCNCGKGADRVVPTFLNYVSLNSKLWGVLSTIPILLQAKNFNKFSNLLSLTTIILDLNRGWLYNIYDGLFERFAKSVKLGIFKERTALYNFFSTFSSRWMYTDTLKKHSYVELKDQKVQVRSYNKLESLEDLDLKSWVKFENKPNNRQICMEIVKNRAYCKLPVDGEIYAHAILKRPVYVS